jgi:hypothetical protein
VNKDIIKQHLEDADLVRGLRRQMKDAKGLTAQQADHVAAALQDMIDEFVRHVDDVDDPEELAYSCACYFVETKTRWLSLNTQMNYQLTRTGTQDPEVLWKGTATSAFLAVVESMLRKDDVQRILTALAEQLHGTNLAA